MATEKQKNTDMFLSLEQRLAIHDPVNCLPNSASLRDQMAALPKEKLDACYLISFQVADMEHFHHLYGSAAADHFLHAVIEWIYQQFKTEYTLFQISMYRYTIVLWNSTQEEMQQYVTAIRTRFNEQWYFSLNGKSIPYFCRIILSIAHASDIPREHDLIDLLERTLHHAQHYKLLVYDKETDQQIQRQIQIDSSLEKCVNQDMAGFEVHFQPIASISNGKWEGVEALCRWNSPEIGRIPPNSFLGPAEQYGLITILGLWVLEQSIICCKKLELDQIDDFFLSVNLSAVQLLDATFVDRVEKLLQKHDYPGNKLNLEITESSEFEHNDITLSTIQKLCALGITFALDDFGTGYSSFENLKKLPIRYLKTEHTFINDIEENDFMQYFIFIMSEMAHENGLHLIVEGVETAEQLKLVEKNGADFIQGFLFSKPLTEDQLALQMTQFSTAEQQKTPDTVMNTQQWLHSKNAYTATPNLFKFMEEGMQSFFKHQDFKSALTEILQKTGKFFHTKTAFTYIETSSDHTYYEWRNKPVDQVNAFKNIEKYEISPTLKDAFQKDGIFIIPNNAHLPKDLQDYFQQYQIKSLLVFPLYDNQRLVGYMGFSDHEARNWHPEEILVLENLSQFVIEMSNREFLHNASSQQVSVIREFMNNAIFNVFVTNPDTDEILWLNDTMLNHYQLKAEDAIGKKCHEVFYDVEAHCTFCKNSDENCTACKNEGRQCSKGPNDISRERDDATWDKSFILYESTIPWDGFTTAHVSISIDVTEMRQMQKNLSNIMQIDLLTGASNREHTLQTLKQLLLDAHHNEQPLSIAFIDINHLKSVNILHGHKTGDQVLCDTTNSVLITMEQDDLIGRIDGDEFLLLMPHCSKSEAEVRMSQALAHYRKHNRTSKNSYDFRYGIVQSDEFQYHNDDMYLVRIIATAESRANAHSAEHIQLLKS